MDILRRPADFRRLREQGKVARSHLVVLVHVANGLPILRYAVVASRKVGKATRRNRAKRILREAQRSLHRKLRLRGLDLLLIANPNTARASSRELEEQIFRLYRAAEFSLDGAVTPQA